jgi:hypothetical protein
MANDTRIAVDIAKSVFEIAVSDRPLGALLGTPDRAAHRPHRPKGILKASDRGPHQPGSRANWRPWPSSFPPLPTC